MNLRLTLLLLSFCSSTSCALVDPGYPELVSTVETNPQPDAIVGMWHRKYGGDTLHDAHWHSELFKPDGTGVRTWYMPDPILGVLNTDSVNQSTWTYSGNGVWHVKYDFSGYRTECRLSQGKLLQTIGNDCMVLERMNQ